VPENVEISVSLDEGLHGVRADSNLLKRVFTNLLTNGIQAMPDGGTLSVTGSVSGGMVSLVVSDTGVGVSEENMGKLFQPLFTTKAKGTGLGLAVCKKIVEAHGGEISFESEEGAGTSFVIKFPVHPDEDLAETRVSDESEPIALQEQPVESRHSG